MTSSQQAHRHNELTEIMATCPFETLGLYSSATIAEVNVRYRRLALQFHPDRNLSPEAAERMVSINNARDRVVEILRNNSSASTPYSGSTSYYESPGSNYVRRPWEEEFNRPEEVERRKRQAAATRAENARFNEWRRHRYEMQEAERKRADAAARREEVERRERQAAATRAENARVNEWRRHRYEMQEAERKRADAAARREAEQQREAERQREAESQQQGQFYWDDEAELTEGDYRRHEETLDNIYAEHARRAREERIRSAYVDTRRVQEHAEQMAAMCREHQARLQNQQAIAERLRAEAALLAEQSARLVQGLHLSDQARAAQDACVREQIRVVDNLATDSQNFRTIRHAKIIALQAEQQRGRRRHRTSQLREEDFDLTDLHKPYSSTERSTSSKRRASSPPDAGPSNASTEHSKRRDPGSKDRLHGRERMRNNFEAHRAMAAYPPPEAEAAATTEPSTSTTEPPTPTGVWSGFWNAVAIPLNLLDPKILRKAVNVVTRGVEHLNLVDTDGNETG